MPLQTFRHYTICQDRAGTTVEVWRSAGEVACLAFDNKQRIFVELHVAIGPAERQRAAPAFQNLVQLAAPLRHRHLLGIMEGGEDDGANYHVSEFLDGERLDTWLARCHPLPPWLALLMIRQLVEGLAALASHPRLLAGVEVFHAGLTLTGPHSDDLEVKICDLGLSGTRPVSTEPQFVEARAIHDTGRLLLYMLTGSVSDEPVTASSLAGRNIPPEMGFLLGTIFTATMPHHPRTLEQLRTLIERCAHDLAPELTAHPDLLPAAFHPRLPLASYLPDPATLADALGHDYTLDLRPPDAADPYRHRATQRSTRRPVTVQLLPPPCLIPENFLHPAMEGAWAAAPVGTAAGPGQAVNPLLVPLAWQPDFPGPLLVEEFPGKFSLETLRRLRQPLEPAEADLILTQLDAAATAAERAGLPLHWRSPRLVPVQFTAPGAEEALPSLATLARLPLTEWPAFQLKCRTWPTALDFTQPDRFQLERLLPRDPALANGAPAIRAAPGALPTARDFALLTTWLLGGTPQVPETVKSLLFSTISARGPAPASRREFLERFRQRFAPLPGPVTAPVAMLDPGTAPAGTLTLGKGKTKGQARLKTAPPATGSRSGKSSSPSIPASPVPATPLRPGVLESPGPAHTLAAAETAEVFPIGRHAPEEEEAPAALGFAEALFGSQPERGAFPDNFPGATATDSDTPAAPLWPAFAEDNFPLHDLSGNPPLGFMEAAALARPDQNMDYAPPPPSGSRWMLFLTVILIAAALAALMAQLSGQAVWLK